MLRGVRFVCWEGRFGSSARLRSCGVSGSPDARAQMPKRRQRDDDARSAAVFRAGGLKVSRDAARRIADALLNLDTDKGAELPDIDVGRWTVPLYGSVVKYLEAPNSAGGVAKLPVVDPVALLLFFCRRRPEFGDFLRKHVGNKTSTLVIWMDDTTPGLGYCQSMDITRGMQTERHALQRAASENIRAAFGDSERECASS